MKIIDRVSSAVERGTVFLRRRPWVDHVWRAQDRYSDVNAGHLAAAISYYGFFASFALAMLAFSVFGFVLDSSPAVGEAVTEWLQDNLPFLDVANIQGSRTAVGVIGLVGFLLTGIGWVEAMRSSIRAVWLLDQHPGNYFIRRGVDILALMGLGLLLAASIAFSVLARAGITWLGDSLRIGGMGLGETTNVLYLALAVLIDWVLATAMLTGLPRLRMSFARLLPAGLIIAVGLELLKTVGQFYINRTQHNPAYQIVVGAVGLLIFLNLFSQLLLWGSALAATSTSGGVRDLANGRDLPDGSVEVPAGASAGPALDPVARPDLDPPARDTR